MPPRRDILTSKRKNIYINLKKRRSCKKRITWGIRESVHTKLRWNLSHRNQYRKYTTSWRLANHKWAENWVRKGCNAIGWCREQARSHMKFVVYGLLCAVMPFFAKQVTSFYLLNICCNWTLSLQQPTLLTTYCGKIYMSFSLIGWHEEVIKASNSCTFARRR